MSNGETTKITRGGLAALAALYIIWGSTYLANRIAVREGSGFPPFSMAFARSVIAACLLFGIMSAMGKFSLPSRKDVSTLIISGLLLWVGGNGLVTWAVQTADSGYAALSVGTLPLWTAVIESIVDRKRPPPGLVGALLVGFTGLVILNWPVISAASHITPAATIALTAAPLCWASGAVLQSRRKVALPPMLSGAYQQAVGAMGFLVLVYLTNEPTPDPKAEAFAAFSYVTIAGGVIAFSSFLYALKHLPVTMVSTYAFANPIIAVFLGWLILSEPLTPHTIVGATLILLGVAGVFRWR